MFLYSINHPCQVIMSGPMWLCLEILTKSTGSLGLFLCPSGSGFDPDTFSAECWDAHFLCYFHDSFLIVTYYKWIHRSFPKCDPITHVYPSSITHILLPLLPRTVTRYRTVCYTAGCLKHTARSRVWINDLPNPSIPTPSPPIWQPPSVGQSKDFFPVGRFLGVICKIQEEGMSHGVCVPHTDTFHFIWTFHFPTLWLPMAPFSVQFNCWVIFHCV